MHELLLALLLVCVVFYIYMYAFVSPKAEHWIQDLAVKPSFVIPRMTFAKHTDANYGDF